MRRIFVVVVVFFTSQTLAGGDEVNEGVQEACMDGWNACREVLLNGRCFNGNVWKRGSRTGELGPFWANRGKKDPFFPRSMLYAQEPQWELIHYDGDGNYDPYFSARGKKLTAADVRDRRNSYVIDDASPFSAARGKRDSYVH